MGAQTELESFFPPPPEKQDKKCISPWFRPLSLMSSIGLPALRVRYGINLKQKHQWCPASPCAMTHATLDEKVTSPSASVGTHTGIVSLAAQDF